ncbi:MAG TPA: hypothetical protein VML50_00860 [Anaeromyxobacter sp.]|nr:hypothetical protein [Anaeromyxobacter sp.]
MSRPAPTRRDVERERARALAARRALPWAAASAAGLALLVAVAGGGWRGAAVVGGLGLALAGFLLAAAVARCPACGAALPSGAAGGEGCARCRARFE